jgi:hypothetical protein
MGLRKLLPAAAALWLLSGAASHATILLNDNFDAENGGVPQLNYFNFANFVVSNASSGGAVDLIGNGFFDFYPGNGLYVDICGSLSACGVLTTKQTFAPGNYTITLGLGGNARAAVTDSTGVTLGSFVANFPLGENTIATETLGITLTTASALSISDQGLLGPDIGNILFSVEVANDATAIPEPTSLLLLGAGLLTLAGAVGRRG